MTFPEWSNAVTAALQRRFREHATLEKNLAAFNERCGTTVEAVRSAASQQITFSPTPDGAVCGEVDGRALCSRRAPLAEAKRIADGIDPIQSVGVLVMGFGMGWHVKALYERLGRCCIIVVFEPNVERLRSVLSRVDHSDWIGNVMITDGQVPGEFFGMMRGLEGTFAVGWDVVGHLPTMAEWGEYEPEPERVADAPDPFAQYAVVRAAHVAAAECLFYGANT